MLHPRKGTSLEAGERDDHQAGREGRWGGLARRSSRGSWVGSILALGAALAFGLAFWIALAFLVYRLLT